MFPNLKSNISGILLSNDHTETREFRIYLSFQVLEAVYLNTVRTNSLCIIYTTSSQKSHKNQHRCTNRNYPRHQTVSTGYNSYRTKFTARSPSKLFLLRSKTDANTFSPPKTR